MDVGYSSGNDVFCCESFEGLACCVKGSSGVAGALGIDTKSHFGVQSWKPEHLLAGYLDTPGKTHEDPKSPLDSLPNGKSESVGHVGVANSLERR